VAGHTLPKPRADRCIFCDGVPVNEEHIFPRKWLARLWKLEQDEKLGHGHKRGGTETEESETWWNRREASLVVWCVCDRCNSGWMNRLDQRTQEIIEPLVLGERARVGTLREKYLVAAWVAKLAFMFDYQQDRSTIPLSLARQFHVDRLPLERALIWLAASPPAVSGHAAGAFWTLGTRRDNEQTDELFFLTARVDHLVAQIVVPLLPGGQVRTVRHRFQRHVRALWPMTYEAIAWPPAEILSDIDYVEFCDSLAANLRRL
jgi:hypothetical protein